MNVIGRRVSLLPILILFALPLHAGRDISDIRYAVSNLPMGVPAIASNGTRFLTLWAAPHGERPNVHINGSLSDAAGSSNSPAFPAVPWANSDVVSVVAAGSGYVAMWNEQNVGPSFGRLTSDGILKWRRRLASRFSAAASNGREIAIVDTFGVIGQGSTINLWIYDLDGNLLRSSPLMHDEGETYAVTAAGDDFVVITAGRSGIIEWRAPHDGVVHAVVRILPARAYVKAVAVAAKNGRVVTAWIESPSTASSGTLASATIQPDGTVTSTSFPAGATPAAAPAVLPVAAGGYVIAWNTTPAAPAQPGMFALRLDDDGALIDDQPSFLGDGQFTSAAMAGDIVKLACYASSLPNGVSIVTATVNATGLAAGPPVPIVSQIPQFAPALAGNGAGFTAAWLEAGSEALRVMAGRINPAGELLDGPGITIAAHASAPPVISHGAFEELIVWIGNGHLQAARLSPFGQVLDASPLIIAPATYGSYDVVWNGSRFFVVWTDFMSFFSASVGPDGTVTPVSLLHVVHDPGAGKVDLAWDGRQHILLFEEDAPVGCDACGVHGDFAVTRISASGAVIDTVPAKILFSAYRAAAHLATSGSESLVVLDRDAGASSIVVRDQGGTLHLDPEVSLFKWSRGTSAVAWDGTTYVVAVRYALSQSDSDSGGLAEIHVGQSGARLQTTTVPATGPPDYALETAPAIATDAAAGTAFAITELMPQSYAAQARLYFPSDLSPASAAAPPAPRNAVSYFGGTTARIDWQSDGGANGFVIDRSTDLGASWSPAATASADARTITVDATIGDLFRVRAFGPGGVSEGTVTSIGSMPRRRAERP